MKVTLFGDEYGLPSIVSALSGFNSFQPVLIVYSHKRGSAKSVAISVSRDLNCSVIEHPDRNSSEYIDFFHKIRNADAQIGICFSYDLILSKDILDCFPLGVINHHGAFLPKYRGANVLNWLLVNGESETGVTIHKMVRKVDAGPILIQQRLPISFTDTAVTLLDKMNSLARQLLKAVWPDISKEQMDYTEQDDSQATVFQRRTFEDGFFSWDWEAEKIYNMIRALVHPWPGAWYLENGEQKVIDYFIPLEEVKKMQENILRERNS